MSDRRLAGFYVTPQMMYQVLHGWKKDGEVCLFHLDFPIDAKFISTNWEAQRQAFLMVFEHESFDIIQEGCSITINSPYVEKITIPSEILKETK